jgi:hypothetical protein
MRLQLESLNRKDAVERRAIGQTAEGLKLSLPPTRICDPGHSGAPNPKLSFESYAHSSKAS